MKILRWILFSLLSLLLAATIFGWVVSHFSWFHITYTSENTYTAFGSATGLMGFTVETQCEPATPSGWREYREGLDFDSRTITSSQKEFLKKTYPWGFEYRSDRPQKHSVMFPFWLAALVLGAAETFWIWKILVALRRKKAPAFPVEAAEAKGAGEAGGDA